MAFAVVFAAAGCASGQARTGPVPDVQSWPARAVRRDIPMDAPTRRSYSAGTRDSTGRPGRSYWQQTVDYRLDATLDPATSLVTGRGTIKLHNTSPDSLPQIVLRLYQNFFSARVERNDYVTDITDGVTVEQLSVNGVPIPVGDRTKFIVRETVATITPGFAIKAGATATIDIAWRFAVPAVDTTVRGQRMGRYGQYLYQVAQWYPQVAMYDDIRGWDTDPYLGNAEFYNQFGSFDVRITAPGGWLVGATGTHENPEQVYSARTRDRLALAMRTDTTVLVVKPDERGASSTAPGRTLTWHFTAPMVNDFAFAASRDYTLDATHATIPGKGKIPVNVLYLPQHENYRKNNTAQFGRQALEQFSSWLFPYEFSQGTIADGPETGMEYPMIIFNGSSLGVTTHEFNHQWFPMMVGSNETRYGFMDEGFVEYSTSYAIAAITNGTVDLQNRAAQYRRVAGSSLEAPMMWPTLHAGPNSTIATYSKGEVALNALGAVVGDSAVKRAFSEYALAWKFRHPTPYDFFFSMNRSLGQNLDWFWYGWFFTNYALDQAIESVRTEGGSAVVTVRDKDDLAMPVILAAEFTDGTSQTVSLPASVWFSGSRSAVAHVPLRGRTLKKISLDPENRFQDLSRGDNVWEAVGVRPVSQ